MSVITLNEIKTILQLPEDLIPLRAKLEDAYRAFSAGEYEVPIPMQFSFEKENGDCHVKGGFKRGGDYFAAKLVTGFYDNAAKGLPHGDGITVVFDQQTGLIKGMIKDQGYLTTVRTALASIVAAGAVGRHYKKIGVVGAGQLGEMVVQMMHYFYPDKQIILIGRTTDKVESIAAKYDYVQASSDIKSMVAECDLVVTATASRQAFIDNSFVKGDLHIIAMGADEEGKQELDPALVGRADLIIVDSLRQCTAFGEVSYAYKDGLIDADEIVELGKLLADSKVKEKAGNAGLVITDLTGIAPQDLVMAEWVMDIIN